MIRVRVAKHSGVPLLVAATLVIAACSSTTAQSSSTTAPPAGATSAKSGGTASARGVTANTITVGLITSLTGTSASYTATVLQAVEARIDQQNAQGGVDGRQIKLVTQDDASTIQGNLTASNIMASKDVFAVIDETAFAVGGYRVLQKAGIPVTGGAWDGPEWGEQPNTNMFAWAGLTDPTNPTSLDMPEYYKSKGATKVAIVTWGSPPSAVAGGKIAAAAFKADGLPVVYENLSIPTGSADMTATALAIKSSGADALYPNMGENSDIALAVNSLQDGIHYKVLTLTNGYGNQLLTQPAALQALQGASFSPRIAPVEINTPATRNFSAALAKYVGFTGVPDFGYDDGWPSADLLITGLQAAGSNPTRQSFITNLRKVTVYTAGGLLPAPANLSAFGTESDPACQYYVVLKGKSFVPDPSSGKPVCGKLIHSAAS